jgi:hypothetical protein
MAPSLWGSFNEVSRGRLTRRAGSDVSTLGLDDVEMDDEQWWTANAHLLARVLDERTYPLATRVGTAAGAAHRSAHDPAHAYDFGLHCVLDGLATLIDNRQVPPIPKIVESES